MCAAIRPRYHMCVVICNLPCIQYVYIIVWFGIEFELKYYLFGIKNIRIVNIQVTTIDAWSGCQQTVPTRQLYLRLSYQLFYLDREVWLVLPYCEVWLVLPNHA